LQEGLEEKWEWDKGGGGGTGLDWNLGRRRDTNLGAGRREEAEEG